MTCRRASRQARDIYLWTIDRRQTAAPTAASPPTASRNRLDGSGTAARLSAWREPPKETASEPRSLPDESPKLQLAPSESLGANEPAKLLDNGLPEASLAAIVTRP